MPVRVVRQQANGPPPAAAPKGKVGSVLSKGIPVGDLKSLYVKMLLYGGNGIGKTTLSCTFPKPLLLIALEQNDTGGALSVRKVAGVTHLRPGARLLPDGTPDPDYVPTNEEVLNDVERLGAELKQSNPFKTVVFDHVTVFQSAVLGRVMGEPTPEQLGKGKVSIDQWTQRAEMVKTLLRPFLDLRCNTVFIGKERDHNPPKDEKVTSSGKLMPDLRPKFLRGMQAESFVSVDLGGGAAGWLQDACDYACRLYMDEEMRTVENRSTIQGKETVHREVVKTGRYVRALRLAYHPNYFSRFRADTPEALPDAIEDPSWEKIRAVIEGRPVPAK